MWELLKAIQKIIKRYIVNEQTTTAAASAGATTIEVVNGRRLTCGDNIVLYQTGSNDGEMCIVTKVEGRTVTLNSALKRSWASGTKMQKLVGMQWCRGVHIGDPPVIGQYPAICIAPSHGSTEYLTIAGTSDKYELDISVYVEAAHFEVALEYQIKTAEAIKEALFKTLYPLVEPYDLTTLAEDVEEGDMVIRVADDSKIGQYALFWLENNNYSTSLKPICVPGNGVVELAFPVDASFSAGDDVIMPVRHFYDQLPSDIDYGYVVKDTLLKAAKISYRATEERFRHRPNYDTFLR